MTNTLFLFLMATSNTAPELHVEGQGYLRFAKDGAAVYARAVRLQVVKGLLCGPGGSPLLPEVPAPASLADLRVELDGRIMAKRGGSDIELGRIVLAIAPNELLKADGDYLICEDRPKLTNPGEGVAGIVRLGGQSAPATPAAAPQITKALLKPTVHPVETGKRPAVNPIQANGKSTIALLAKAEVTGDVVKLADIATITGPEALGEVEVAPSPAVGVERIIDITTIQIKLRAAGIDPTKIDIAALVPVHVKRKAQKIDATRWATEAKAVIFKQIGTEIPIQSDDSQPPMDCPDGALSFGAEQVNLTQTGATVRLAVYVDGKRWNSRTVALHVDAATAGVTSGSSVKIRLRSGGATVEVTGKARTAGWIGQTITVTTDTGSTHQAKVLGPGLVEVNL